MSVTIKDFTFENYVGDVNPHHGGLFFDPSDQEYGYANCLQISEYLGWSVMIEYITVNFDPENVPDDPKMFGAFLQDTISESGYDPDSYLMPKVILLDSFFEESETRQLEFSRFNKFDHVIPDDADYDLSEYLYDNSYLSQFE